VILLLGLLLHLSTSPVHAEAPAKVDDFSITMNFPGLTAEETTEVTMGVIDDDEASIKRWSEHLDKQLSEDLAKNPNLGIVSQTFLGDPGRTPQQEDDGKKDLAKQVLKGRGFSITSILSNRQVAYVYKHNQVIFTTIRLTLSGVAMAYGFVAFKNVDIATAIAGGFLITGATSGFFGYIMPWFSKFINKAKMSALYTKWTGKSEAPRALQFADRMVNLFVFWGGTEALFIKANELGFMALGMSAGGGKIVKPALFATGSQGIYENTVFADEEKLLAEGGNRRRLVIRTQILTAIGSVISNFGSLMSMSGREDVGTVALLTLTVAGVYNYYRINKKQIDQWLKSIGTRCERALRRGKDGDLAFAF